MKPQLTEAHVAEIMEHLLERFGEPIGDAQGDRQGIPSKGGRKEKMGNRGFGAKLEHVGLPGACGGCGGMMGIEGDTCTNCGEMPNALEPSPSPPKTAGNSVAIVVKGSTPEGGSRGGKFAQGLKVKDMDGIPSTGSGRGTQAPASPPKPMPKAPAPGPAEPTPMPATLDQADLAGADELDEESTEDKQERLHYDIDRDGEVGESPEHREKVLGHEDDELDEDAMPSGSSSPPPPPSSSSPAPAPKPPSPPPSSGGSSPPPPSGGSSSSPPPAEEMQEDMDLDEVTPPGREKQVKALKKKGDVKNPWAVAWSSYNKSHKK